MLQQGFTIVYILVFLAYLTAGISALVRIKPVKYFKVASKLLTISASMAALILSTLKLVTSNDVVDFGIESNLGFLSFHFSIDNLSAFFIIIISLISLIVFIYSISYMKGFEGVYNGDCFYFLYNIFILSMILVVSSSNIFMFLVLWEIMSLVSYFLVIYQQKNDYVQKAGTLYIIMTHIGTAFIIAAFVLMYVYSGGNADWASLNSSSLPAYIKNTVFVFLLIGFGTKAGVIPFHIWLPPAYEAAPSNISALLSGVMKKTAIYGIIRVIVVVMDGQQQWWGSTLIIIGGISAILGILYALMEIDIKNLLAYSSIENTGIILIGIGLTILARSSENQSLALFSLTAAVFHTFNHSVFKSLLFLGAGSVEYSTGTNNMEDLGGLIKKMPYTALFFLIGSLSVSAIPPFNGFISKWLTYIAIFCDIIFVQIDGLTKIILILTVAILAMAGSLSVYGYIKLFGISFLAMPRTSKATAAKEVKGPMLISMGMLSIISLLAGIFPICIVKVIDGVNIQVFGYSMANNMSVISGFVFYLTDIKEYLQLSPAYILAAMAALGVLIYYLKSALSKGTKIRSFGTWDCGYIRLNPKMQYTATGFSKPMRIIFRGIFKPQRELQIEEGASRYFFKSAKYLVSTESLIEKYMYKPITESILKFSRRMRFAVQTGSIHTYLLYMFIVIVAMFIYYAKA